MGKKNSSTAVSLRLTFDVTFEDNESGMSAEEVEACARERLQGLIDTAMNRGMVTGDTPLEVESHTVRISRIGTDGELDSALFQPHPVPVLGKPVKSPDQFPRVDFKDAYGHGCKIQASAVVYDYAHSLDQPGSSAIWLGINDPKPEIMARDAHLVGVQTEKKVGWVPFPIPQGVLVHTHMHLNREQVSGLIVRLQEWMAKGEFSPAAER